MTGNVIYTAMVPAEWRRVLAAKRLRAAERACLADPSSDAALSDLVEAQREWAIVGGGAVLEEAIPTNSPLRPLRKRWAPK